MRWLVVLVAACSAPARQLPPAVPAPVKPVEPPVAKPQSPWPMPMRVMAWTPDGVVQVGTLPDAPPAQPPATAWYVEPTGTLDRAAFDRVVAAIRREQVPGLSLRGQPVAAWLGDLPALQALILDDTEVDAIAFDTSRLRRLYLARTFVDDAVVAKLQAPLLEVLDLEDCAITDRGALDIAKLGELRALNLAGTRVTDEGGALLGGLRELAVLDLGGTQVGAKTLAAIRPLALVELYLDHTRVGRGLDTLAGYAPGIARFDVSALQSYKPTDADLAWLAKAPNLVEVGLSGSKVTDALVHEIAQRPNLREVRLAGTRITIATIGQLAMLTRLEEVDLAQTPVGDAEAARFVAMPAMRALRLDDTRVGDAALAGKPSGKLVELYLSRTKVTDAGLAILDQLPKLEGLGLAEAKLADESIARIARLSELRTLVLSKTRTGRAILAELGKLHQLERLYLDDSRIGDDQLPALAKLRQLRVLHLAGTDVSELALPTLHAFTLLDELTIGDTRMRTAIADLSHWPRLRTLSMMGLELTDDDLGKLALRRSLVTLDLSATEVKDPSPLRALANLRTLGLVGARLSPQGQQAVKQLVARGVEVIR